MSADLTRYTVYGALCVALTAAPGAGQSGRSGGLEFFRLPAGAGPAALGEAVTSTQGGIGSVLYNPAAVARTTRLTVGFSFLDSPELFESRYAGLAVPLGDRSAGAAFAKFVTFDAIALADENGASLGDFAPHASVFGVAVTRSLGSTVDLGFAAKWMSVELAPSGLLPAIGSGSDARASGWGMDAGAVVRLGTASPLKLGVALLDIGPAMHLGTDGDQLPSRLRLGVSLDVTSVLAHGRQLPVDAVLAVDRVAELSADATSGSVHAGIEVLVFDLVALRGGIASTQPGGDAPRRVVGLGVMHSRAHLEFAYELSGSPALENQTHVSVAIRF